MSDKTGKLVRYQGKNYRLVVSDYNSVRSRLKSLPEDLRFDDADYRHDGIVFFMDLLFVHKSGEGLPSLARKVSSIPRTIAQLLNDEQKQLAKAALAHESLYYIKLGGDKITKDGQVPGDGWRWRGKGKSFKKVGAVQEALDFYDKCKRNAMNSGVIFGYCSNRFV